MEWWIVCSHRGAELFSLNGNSSDTSSDFDIPVSVSQVLSRFHSDLAVVFMRCIGSQRTLLTRNRSSKIA